MTETGTAVILWLAVDRRTRRELMERLTVDARRIASAFDLEYRSIEAERANVKSRYGVCYDDGSIKIRLSHAVTGQALRYSSLVNTLCHELAHLRHFNHGPRFKAFYLQLLEWSRRQGIYRPRTPERRPAVGFGEGARAHPTGPVVRPPTARHEQLDLFG